MHALDDLHHTPVESHESLNGASANESGTKATWPTGGLRLARGFKEIRKRAILTFMRFYSISGMLNFNGDGDTYTTGDER